MFDIPNFGISACSGKILFDQDSGLRANLLTWIPISALSIQLPRRLGCRVGIAWGLTRSKSEATIEQAFSYTNLINSICVDVGLLGVSGFYV